MVLNVALNFMLIPLYGIIGSAVATLISYTVSTFSIVTLKDGRFQTLMMFKSLSPTTLLNYINQSRKFLSAKK